MDEANDAGADDPGRRGDETAGGRPAVDRADAVRPGEELEAARVEPFLRRELPDLEGEIEIRQFPAGHSNLTYQVRVGDRELVLRRPPFGDKPKSGHDMRREYTVLSALHGTFPYCPRPLAFSDDPAILGSPFYVMERLEGIIVRRTFPPGVLRSAGDATRLFERVVDVLAELHNLDYRRLGLESFGRPEGYVERQVTGWCSRFRRVRTPDVPDFSDVMCWLIARMPAESGRACIIHNDYKLDNVVLDPQNPLDVIGVLDWEMATVGDPLMDLGETLAYWTERHDPQIFRDLRTTPTDVEGALTRREVVERYAAATGADVERLDFYYCFGLFRLAVISQQIYYRYYRGQSHDLRFGMFGHSVQALETACRSVIGSSAL